MVAGRMAERPVDAAGVLGIDERDGQRAAALARPFQRAPDRRLRPLPQVLVVRLMWI